MINESTSFNLFVFSHFWNVGWYSAVLNINYSCIFRRIISPIKIAVPHLISGFFAHFIVKQLFKFGCLSDFIFKHILHGFSFGLYAAESINIFSFYGFPPNCIFYSVCLLAEFRKLIGSCPCAFVIACADISREFGLFSAYFFGNWNKLFG